MSGETFAARWLALRAPHDSAARSVALEERLRRALPEGARIVDLGAGRGGNLLHLAPRLGGHQRWHLVDHDVAHLDALPGVIAGWAGANEAHVTSTSSALRLVASSFEVEVTWDVVPLARDLSRAIAGAHAVVTSALLDLAGEVWLDELAASVAESGCLLLATLSVDGRHVLAPEDAADREVLAAFHAHMRREKGLGPALGPAAAAHLAARLAGHGLDVERRTSDWELDRDVAIQEALLAGIAAAASEAGCAAAGPWLARRKHFVRRGESRLRVGHEDLYAGPLPREPESR